MPPCLLNSPYRARSLYRPSSSSTRGLSCFYALENRACTYESNTIQMDPKSSFVTTMPKSEANVAELIAQSFSPFNHRENIAEPFDNETKRDGEFRDSEGSRNSRTFDICANFAAYSPSCFCSELSKMMIDLMIEFHAWSTSRPMQESDRTADLLEKEISGIIETEVEQGRSSTSIPHIYLIGMPMFRLAFPSPFNHISFRHADSYCRLKRKRVKNSMTSLTVSRWL